LVGIYISPRNEITSWQKWIAGSRWQTLNEADSRQQSGNAGSRDVGRAGTPAKAIPGNGNPNTGARQRAPAKSGPKAAF